MGTAITDASHVALFDDTTMEASGPIFDSAEHAEDFLAWWNAKWPSGAMLPTDYEPESMERDHAEWAAERLDDDGYLLEVKS